MDVEVISDVGTFKDLESEWNALAERCPAPTPQLRHEWFAAAFDAFGGGCDLAIHVAREEGRVRAIAPFVIERGLLPRLVLLGYQAYEPSGILHDCDEALQLVLCGLWARRLPVFMPLLARDSAEARATASGPLWRLQPLQRFRCSASAPLGPSWAAFEARMSKQSRTYIRRKRKAAEREGAVRVEVVAPLEDEVESHLDELIRVEGAGWKSREGTSMQRDERMRRLCTAYARAAARRAMLRMFFLRAGQKTMAARMAVEYRGELWEIKIGYDEKFSACSPGIVLTHETLRWACEHGLMAHRFLGSAEPWQRWWPLELRYYQNIRLYPFSVPGCVTLLRDAGQLATGRLRDSSVRRFTPLLGHLQALGSSNRSRQILRLSDKA
jgi:CelD/BcsL family acetyltransferase involved in cellulose biosynthesis